MESYLGNHLFLLLNETTVLNRGCKIVVSQVKGLPMESTFYVGLGVFITLVLLVVISGW